MVGGESDSGEGVEGDAVEGAGGDAGGGGDKDVGVVVEGIEDVDGLPEEETLSCAGGARDEDGAAFRHRPKHLFLLLSQKIIKFKSMINGRRRWFRVF